MADNSTLPSRHSVRLPGYDYSQEGSYFVTICTEQRLCLLAGIVAGRLHLNAAGQMVNDVWGALPARFPDLVLDAHVVMPNHLHAVLTLTSTTISRQNERTPLQQFTCTPHGTLPGTIGRIIQAFKSLTTHAYTLGVKNEGWQPYPGKLWQRNYYERIIRNQPELSAVRQYIQANPACWSDDTENLGRQGSAGPR